MYYSLVLIQVFFLEFYGTIQFLNQTDLKLDILPTLSIHTANNILAYYFPEVTHSPVPEVCQME